MSRRLEVLRSLKSREAIVWVGTFTLMFTAAVAALEATGSPTVVAFVAGIAFAELADWAVDSYTDSYLERRGLTDEGRTDS